MNVYWASQHYDGLAQIRRQHGLATGAATPAFLITAHESALRERAERGAGQESKVRVIARRVMERAWNSSGKPDS
jgi:hypothetical protein